MDVLYEESAVNAKSEKAERRYKIFNVLSWIFGVIGVFFLFFLVQQLLALLLGKPTGDDRAAMIGQAIFLSMPTLFFGLGFVYFFLIKRRMNISYDYIFVSGELRISKVFNVNRRKLIARIDSESILKIGDVDNSEYGRIKGDPSVKEVICTPNVEAAENKFFMYIYATESGSRKIFLLECREELLVNILRFVKRGTLEADYVEQSKKRK